MKIKPKYTDPETTPLKFLKLVRVTLWISLFFTTMEIISQLSSELDWYMLGINLVGGVLLVAAISGLNRMEWYGVKAYCGSLLLRILDNLLACGLYLYYGRVDESLSTAAGICGGGVVILLIWIYFQKRRLLFTPIPEQYLPLLEKEREQVQALSRDKESEPVQPVETVSEPQSVKEMDDRCESQFCQNCGNPLIRGSNFCNLCGKVVSSTVLEEPTRKKRKSRLGFVVALLVVALAAGVFLLREDSEQSMLPAQAAENVLYLEVYNDSDECIGSGSGFLVEDRTTLVTNYHVVENACYLLVITQDNQVGAVADAVLAYDVDMDLAVLRCDREVEVQPLVLGNSETVKQGDKIYAAGYPLGIANTLSDGIVSSMYVDKFGVEMLQITAPISHGSSGGALLNENGQVVGVVCGFFDEGQNMNLAIAVNQLYPLLEAEKENTLAVKTEDAQPKEERVPEETVTQKKEEPPKLPVKPEPAQPEEPPKEEKPSVAVVPEPPKEEPSPKEELPVEETPEPAAQPVSISLSQSTLFLAKGDSKTLTIQIQPADAVGTVVWNSSDPEVVEVADGVVTARKTNLEYVTITATTENGLSAECRVFEMKPEAPWRDLGGVKVYSRFPQILSIENVAGYGKEIGLRHESESSNTNTYFYNYKTPTKQSSEEIVMRYISYLQSNGYRISACNEEHYLYDLNDPTGYYKVHVRREKTDYQYYIVDVWIIPLNQGE